MKKRTLTYISSIICLVFFIFLAFGSMEDENNNKTTVDSKTYNSSRNFDAQLEKDKQTNEPIKISKTEEKERVEQFINNILKIDEQTSKSTNNVLDLVKNSTNPYQYIELLKDAKKNSESTMFSISDLKIPYDINTETKSSLKIIRENLSQKHSYTSMAIGMLISFLKTDNMNYFYGYLDDYEKAVDYHNLALREILTNGVIMELMIENQREVIKQKLENTEVEREFNNNKKTHPNENSKTDLNNSDSKVINADDGSNLEKSKKEQRREKRAKKKEEKKKKRINENNY